MGQRMVRVKRTVTVVSEVPVENYSTGHSLKDHSVKQMTDDEIRDFENRAKADPEQRPEELAEALMEALQMEPVENQDFAVVVTFFDKDDDKDLTVEETGAPLPW